MAEPLNMDSSLIAHSTLQQNGEQPARATTPVEDENPGVGAAVTNGAQGDDEGAVDDFDDSDEEDHFNIVIKNNAAAAPIGVMAAQAQQSGAAQSSVSMAGGVGGTVFKGGVGQLTGMGPRVVQQKVGGSGAGGVEMDLIPSINGVLLTEMDLENLEDKPWRLPGADLSDYFNYGFTEETWGAYCEKQKRLRAEASSRGLVLTNRLMTGTIDYKAPQVIQTISRSDNFSEEQKNLLGAVSQSSIHNSGGSNINTLSASSVEAAAPTSNSITTISSISTIGSSNNHSLPANVLPKLNNDPGQLLPPFMPPGMPPMPPPFHLPFPGMHGAPPPGFPAMPPGLFPSFPAAIPVSSMSGNTPSPFDIEMKREPCSPPPDGADDRNEEVQTTREHKRRDRDHSPRERESKKRHHHRGERERSEERVSGSTTGAASSSRKSGGGGGRGRHNSDDEVATSEDKSSSRTYKRSSRKHHKDHREREHYRSRSRDKITPTNDE